MRQQTQTEGNTIERLRRQDEQDTTHHPVQGVLDMAWMAAWQHGSMAGSCRKRSPSAAAALAPTIRERQRSCKMTTFQGCWPSAPCPVTSKTSKIHHQSAIALVCKSRTRKFLSSREAFHPRLSIQSSRVSLFACQARDIVDIASTASNPLTSAQIQRLLQLQQQSIYGEALGTYMPK